MLEAQWYRAPKRVRLYRSGSQLQSIDKPAPNPPVESGCRTGGPRDSRLAAVPKLRARTAFSGLSANRRINLSIRKRRREVCRRFESESRWFRHGLSRFLGD